MGFLSITDRRVAELALARVAPGLFVMVVDMQGALKIGATSGVSYAQLHSLRSSASRAPLRSQGEQVITFMPLPRAIQV